MQKKNKHGRLQMLSNVHVLCIKIEESKWKDVTKEAKEQGMTASELIRRYIDDGLQKS